MFWDIAADTWGQEERAAIERVIESGRYTIGPEVEAFEQAFANYHGVKHAIMVNSGSSANLIAVASLFHMREAPLMPGDEVIVVAGKNQQAHHDWKHANDFSVESLCCHFKCNPPNFRPSPLKQ